MKSQNILKVIEVFKKVAPKATNIYALDMMETNVCGTVHCHAGWFAVGYMAWWRRLKLFNLGYISYQNGVELMSKVTKIRSLSNWAQKNPKIWGNNYGIAMFSHKTAFFHPTRRPNGAENLQHIIDHWTEVYERVRATEQPQQPAYENISKSLAVLPISETSDVINQPVKI